MAEGDADDAEDGIAERRMRFVFALRSRGVTDGRVLAAIHDPAAIARVLAALGRTAAGADPPGYRAPPAAEGDAADDGDAAE